MTIDMQDGKQRPTISACLVVYHEAAVIEQCLRSICSFVDEIIIVHDGPCADDTLNIARKYTDKIFIRERVGEAEPHRAFTFEQASGEWILQIDADEFLTPSDVERLYATMNDTSVSGIWCRWELWNGKETIYYKGLQKLCFFRRRSVAYQGIPHASVTPLSGRFVMSDVVLHHRPSYNNISWQIARKKRQMWVPVHARYFFAHQADIACFQTTADSWISYARSVRRRPIRSLLWIPLKMFLGQLKNGVWMSAAGLTVALQQYLYYFSLYKRVWQQERQNMSR